MKITVQIEGEDAATATVPQVVAPKEILEKAADLGAEDAGPAPTQTVIMEKSAFLKEQALDSGQAPERFRSKTALELQAEIPSTDQIEVKDAGEAPR